jgi:Ca2+-binding RTX toxin-like protein
MAGPRGIINLTNGDDVFPGAGDSNAGDETINGLDGNDTITGGNGIDTLKGGGATATITLYGATVVSLTPMVEHTL